MQFFFQWHSGVRFFKLQPQSLPHCKRWGWWEVNQGHFWLHSVEELFSLSHQPSATAREKLLSHNTRRGQMPLYNYDWCPAIACDPIQYLFTGFYMFAENYVHNSTWSTLRVIAEIMAWSRRYWLKRSWLTVQRKRDFLFCETQRLALEKLKPYQAGTQRPEWTQ